MSNAVLLSVFTVSVAVKNEVALYWKGRKERKFIDTKSEKIVALRQGTGCIQSVKHSHFEQKAIFIF